MAENVGRASRKGEHLGAISGSFCSGTLQKHDIAHILSTWIVATEDDHLHSNESIVAVRKMDAINTDEYNGSNLGAYIFRVPILYQWEGIWPVCKSELP